MKTKPSVKNIKGREILNVSAMEFEPGKIYAVMGSNGSGKSTFARFLALEKGICTDNINYKDESASAKDSKVLKLGYMPQKNFAYRMSVLQNALLTGSSEAEAEKLLQTLGMENLLRSNAKNLSGGETAKLALARILLGKFNVLVLDEPTAAMDFESVYISEKLIKEYAQKNNAAVILITHSIGQAKRIGDEMIFLHNGRVLEQGPVTEILDKPNSEEARRFFDM